MVDIGAVVVNYHSGSDCLRLAEQLDGVCSSLVVVDNSAPSPDLKSRVEEFGFVEYIDSGGNIGYAGGNNLGIQQFDGDCDAYFLVNPDTDIGNVDAIVRLGSKIDDTDGLGILAPAVGGASEEQQHQNTPIARLLLRFGFLPEVQSRSDDLLPRNQVKGCSLILSPKMVDDIGYLNEDFFLYVEEIEYCYRARQQGYDVAFDPKSIVEHTDGEDGDISHPHPYQIYYRTRNSFLLASKRFSGVGRLIYILSIWQILFAIAVNRRWSLLIPWSEGVVDGLRNKTGRCRYLTN